MDNDDAFKGVLPAGDQVMQKDKSRNIDIAGLCKSCRRFIGVETRSGNLRLKCEDEVKLDADDPVVKCSRYEQIGLSLWDMKEMATLIDIKRKVGFLEEDNTK